MGKIASWTNEELVKGVEHIIKEHNLGVRHFDGKTYALFTWGYGKPYAERQAVRIRRLGYKARLTKLRGSMAIWVARK